MCVCARAAVKQLEVSQSSCYTGRDDITKTLLSSKQGIFFYTSQLQEIICLYNANTTNTKCTDTMTDLSVCICSRNSPILFLSFLLTPFRVF